MYVRKWQWLLQVSHQWQRVTIVWVLALNPVMSACSTLPNALLGVSQCLSILRFQPSRGKAVCLPHRKAKPPDPVVGESATLRYIPWRLPESVCIPFHEVHIKQNSTYRQTRTPSQALHPQMLHNGQSCVRVTRLGATRHCSGSESKTGNLCSVWTQISSICFWCMGDCVHGCRIRLQRADYTWWCIWAQGEESHFF